MRTGASTLTNRLLLCGAIAGPLFILALLVESYAVPGFDQRHDLISLLSLGPWGFVQITNFVLAGGLNLLYAVGLWRRLHPGPSGTLAPILVGIYGLGLVVVGVLTTDPANKFPPGSIAPNEPSWHGAIHAVGALIVFVSDAVALAAFIRHFLASAEVRWALYGGASSILMLALFFIAFTSPDVMARFVDAALLVGWMGTSIIAMKLLAAPGR